MSNERGNKIRDVYFRKVIRGFALSQKSLKISILSVLAVIKVTSGELFVEGGGLPGRFRTAQFHFHWGRSDSEGSEHTLNGHSYPLEASNWFFSSNHLLNHRMLLQSFTSIVSTHFVLIKKVFFIVYLYANNSEIVKLTKLIVTFYWQLWWSERIQSIQFQT